MATDSVMGLFQDPQQIQQQQYQQVLDRNISLAKLDPFQRATALIGTGAYQLGGAIGGALGGQDPQLQMATLRNQLAQGKDFNSYEGWAKYAQELSQNNDIQGAVTAAERAKGFQKTGQMQSRVQALINKGIAADQTEAEAIASDDASFREAMGLTRTTPTQQLEKQLQAQAAQLYPGDTASQVSWINQQKERGKAPTDSEVQDIAETTQANTLIKSRVAETDKYLAMVSGPKPQVTFGPLANLTAAAEATGFLGEPGQNTQAQDNIRSYLTEGVNAVLNAAKGVQAKDDALRAQKQIEGFLKLNTNAGAKQALERLKKAQEDVLKSNEVYLQTRTRRTALPASGGTGGGGSRRDELLQRASPEQRKALGL
jgi:hypothetical protein